MPSHTDYVVLFQNNPRLGFFWVTAGGDDLKAVCVFQVSLLKGCRAEWFGGTSLTVASVLIVSLYIYIKVLITAETRVVMWDFSLALYKIVAAVIAVIEMRTRTPECCLFV